MAPRQRPAIIPGQVAEETFTLVPDAVRKLFVNGWTTYVPLTYLTDEYCEKVEDHHKLEPVVRLDTSTGQWVRSGDQLPDRGETSLSFLKWTRAWQRKLGILESIGHPDRARWLAHTQVVMGRPNLEEDWPLWLRYCIAVRKRSLQDGLDPSILQTGVLASVQRAYEQERADAASQAFLSAEMARRNTVTNSSSLPRPHSGALPPSSGSAPAPHATRHVVGKSCNNPPPSVCFVCGSREHLSINCSSPTLVSGKPLLVSRASPDAAWTMSGKSFCFKFNSTRGCSFRSCTNSHVCSLCASPAHGAQACTN